jgi:hypothetical protein
VIALAFAALMLPALLAALAWGLALLVLVVTAPLLLARLVVVALILLATLVWIISHRVSFRKLPGEMITVGLLTSSSISV